MKRVNGNPEAASTRNLLPCWRGSPDLVVVVERGKERTGLHAIMLAVELVVTRRWADSPGHQISSSNEPVVILHVARTCGEACSEVDEYVHDKCSIDDKLHDEESPSVVSHSEAHLR